MDYIKVLENFDRYAELKEQVLELYYRLKPENYQLILQTKEEGVEDWFSGSGMIEQLGDKTEDDFVHVQPSLKGTLLEEIIVKHNAFRTRIMCMPPKSSYSVHRDYTPRIHIPITTNFHSWMLWPHYHKCYHLREGVVYWTDTRLKHSAMNGSLVEDRIHIVMCVDQ